MNFADDASVGSGIVQQDNDKKKKEAALEILKVADRRKVLCLRVLTLAILASAAVVICVSLHTYLSNSEKQDFEDSYQELAEKVLETVGRRLEDRIGAIDYFGLNMVSHTLSMNVKWPKLYVPHVEVRAVSSCLYQGDSHCL